MDKSQGASLARLLHFDKLTPWTTDKVMPSKRTAKPLVHVEPESVFMIGRNMQETAHAVQGEIISEQKQIKLLNN